MKTKHLLAVAVATAIIGIGSVQAQGTFVFNWTENKGGNTGNVLTTPWTTNSQGATTAIDATTTYHSEFTLNEGSLSINRQITSRPDLGSLGAYYAGPLQVPAGGSNITFSVWLNPSAQPGSAESIYNILVNGISVPGTLLANSSQPFNQLQYISGTQIVSVKFDYSISAMFDNSESGIGLSMLNPSPIPEPGTAAIALIGGLSMTLLLTRRKK